ncbi:hypothetical protein [uncultured Eubacterium sp.]|uniref:hypothetical protein n=1 Tax=uncultured Eubacterium sp. TaxID=165185 RepID=UPI0025996DAC|nr:hypothetical protein [uncultured Eubacterium sp.]
MRTKKFLFATTFAMMAACMMMNTSCTEYVDEAVDGGSQQMADKATVKLRFTSPEGDDVSVSQSTRQFAYPITRAELVANGKAMTDLYIFDYNKATKKLLQVLHQSADAEDFAEPTMSFDYGDHTLKVIATRSETPTLQSADGSLWNLADNTAFAMTADAAAPAVLTSSKTSDSFGAVQDVSIGVGQNQSINIQLERIIAKLSVKNTSKFPEDCSTLRFQIDEYKQWDWQSFSAIGKVSNQRILDVTKCAGKTSAPFFYYFLVPEEGYTTDIMFTMDRKGSTEPYTSFKLSGITLQRNHVTMISGSFYNRQPTFQLTLNDAWGEEQSQIEF